VDWREAPRRMRGACRRTIASTSYLLALHNGRRESVAVAASSVTSTICTASRQLSLLPLWEKVDWREAPRRMRGACRRTIASTSYLPALRKGRSTGAVGCNKGRRRGAQPAPHDSVGVEEIHSVGVDEISPRGFIHASNFNGLHEFSGKSRARISTPLRPSPIIRPSLSWGARWPPG